MTMDAEARRRHVIMARLDLAGAIRSVEGAQAHLLRAADRLNHAMAEADDDESL